MICASTSHAGHERTTFTKVTSFKCVIIPLELIEGHMKNNRLVYSCILKK
jgi:hypothetical protein